MLRRRSWRHVYRLLPYPRPSSTAGPSRDHQDRPGTIPAPGIKFAGKFSAGLSLTRRRPLRTTSGSGLRQLSSSRLPPALARSLAPFDTRLRYATSIRDHHARMLVTNPKTYAEIARNQGPKVRLAEAARPSSMHVVTPKRGVVKAERTFFLAPESRLNPLVAPLPQRNRAA